MVFPSLWFMGIDPDTLWDFGQLLLKEDSLGLLNSREVELALYELQKRTNSLISDDLRLPDGFPILQLVLPDSGFAPDFLTYEGYWFCSRSLREALAQPDHVVQFAPVEIIAGGEEVRAQDYRVLRVLARQKAMDLDRSECELEDWVNRITGIPQKVPRFIERFVLLDDLQPRTEMFRVDESSSHVLVADAVAERVLRAGCTGLEFTDPACPRHGPRVVRYRTADGIGEKRVHMLD